MLIKGIRGGYNIYIYINLTTNITFLLKLKFMHNPNFIFCNDIFDDEVRR
jgi:hypothetical protein